MSSPGPSKPRLVVLGGGIAGIRLISYLKTEFDITLVDPKSHMDIRFGAHRISVDPEVGYKFLTPYATLIAPSVFVQGKPQAVRVGKNGESGMVVLEGGKEIPYEFLVIATGGTWADPYIAAEQTTLADRVQNMFDTNDKVKAANSITIVGGGVVGVELAGEIASAFPSKKVTVVHSKPTLVTDKCPKMSEACLTILERKGVRVLLNQKAEFRADGKPSRTSQGEDINSDMHFVCTGQKPNTAFLKSGDLVSAMNAMGEVKVTPSFQVINGDAVLDNVFSIGDCSSLSQVKSGKSAREMAEALVGNLRQRANGKKMTYTWKPMELEPLGVNLGRDDGALMLPNGWVITGWFTSLLKGAREGGTTFGVGFLRMVLGLGNPTNPRQVAI